jgi:hypothetical protein
VASLVAGSLLPRDRPHVALLGVSGTKELTGLRSGNAGVHLRQVYADQRHQFRGWGQAADRAQRFARGLAAGTVNTGEMRPRSTAPHTLVSVWLDAADTHAALAKARVALSESLDQYVAAHPAARLAIEPTAAVADPASHASFRIEDARGAPMGELTPLQVPWPPILLIALRMANLMRASTAPATRAALCWVTLESAGLQSGPSSSEHLGKALALAALRQLHIRAYRQLVADCGANSDRRRRYERRARHLRSRARRLLTVSPTVANSADLHTEGMRWSAVSVLYERLAVLAHEDADRKRILLRDLGVSAANPGDAAPTARIDAFGQWATLLRMRKSATPVTPADKAFRDIVAGLKPHECTLLDQMSMVNANPSAAVELLTTQSAWIDTLIRNLYVCRNLHLHSGVHDLDGSIGLATAGTMIVDATFEIWAAWYAAGFTLTPHEVLRRLADRFDECTRRLRAGTGLDDLDLAQLTGPNWIPGR